MKNDGLGGKYRHLHIQLLRPFELKSTVLSEGTNLGVQVVPELRPEDAGKGVAQHPRSPLMPLQGVMRNPQNGDGDKQVIMPLFRPNSPRSN